jgi:hypothetical protein
MGLAVHLHRELDGWAIEIEHIWPGGMLAPKSQALIAFAQLLPEQDFGQAHGSALLLGECLGRFRAMKHAATTPPPPLRGGSPSPSGGGLKHAPSVRIVNRRNCLGF